MCLLVDGKMLIARSFYGNKVAIPGGTAKKNEFAPCTAHRETFEETGADVHVIKKLITTNNGFDIFLCKPKNSVNLSYSKKFEIKEIFFIKPYNIPHNDYMYPEQLSQILSLLEDSKYLQ